MTSVLRGPASLLELHRRGVLEAVDVHVAARLAALAGETSDAATVALALCVRAVRQGSVVLDLTAVPGTVLPDDTADPTVSGVPLDWPLLADWRAALEGSPLVGTQEAAAPLHREGDLIWLDASWRQEVLVADDLLERSAGTVDVDPVALAGQLARLWPGSGPDDQRVAAAVCALSPVSVLGGGPGTGKTTTVSRLLVALSACSPSPLRIALAAPTGKAAARLAESVRRADPVLTHDEVTWLSGLSSSTLHRLLGARRGAGRYWHHRGNQLPYDVVVVDEASMVSLSMFARLLEALRPGARLVLVGDPDQLASVEAGAVLADLVAGAGPRTPDRADALAAALPVDPPAEVGVVSPGAALRNGVALLTRVRRYAHAGPVDQLAQAVRAGAVDQARAALDTDPLSFVEVPDHEVVPESVVRPVLVGQLRDVADAASAGDAEAALAALGRHRLLCAHRSGPRGVAWWTERVPRWLADDVGVVVRRDGRFAGQPLIAVSNDHDNGLWNGDTGVVVREDGELVAYFATGSAPARVPLGRLGDVRPMYAMTVHRAQGSQFDTVTVVLPPAASPLGTRQTVYTAVSRAQSVVTILGSSGAFAAALARPAQRASGLQARLR